MRSVWHSISVGPPPSRAFSIARFASRYTVSTSVPSTTTPSKPYAAARSARCSTAYSRCVGVEYAHWLLSQMNTTGSRRTPAKFMPSCASPRAIAPSPDHATATRFSSRIRNASAQPTETGSIAGRWLTIASSPRRASAMWTLPSLPAVGPAHVLREDPPRLDAARDVHAHVAVQRRSDVVGAHRRRDPDGRRLVAA